MLNCWQKLVNKPSNCWVAKRLIDRLRNIDMIARFGGDEFTVLLENINYFDDAASVAKCHIADLAKPFYLEIDRNEPVHIGASIGISVYGQHGTRPQLLMDYADAALYKAKGSGRNCFAI
ncbi:MAG: GGDEF domain-containing protein [Methylobacter sp.]|nr:GGDEF domain-containing protein [Methylobacter sp.]